jgi:hypothetical protein
MDILLKFNAWQLRWGNDVTLANFNLTRSRLSSLGGSNRPSWYLPHSITTQRDITDDSTRDWIVWTPAETGNSTEIYTEERRLLPEHHLHPVAGGNAQNLGPSPLFAPALIFRCSHDRRHFRTGQPVSSPYVWEPSGILFHFRYVTYFWMIGCEQDM